MIKIAVAAEGGKVTGHFGHCEGFFFYDGEDGKIVKEEFVENPGHKPGFLPNFLADRGAKVIISGSIGQGALDICGERGVEVITGASGDAKTAAEKYLAGELKSTGAVCHGHDHEHEHEHEHECRHENGHECGHGRGE